MCRLYDSWLETLCRAVVSALAPAIRRTGVTLKASQTHRSGTQSSHPVPQAPLHHRQPDVWIETPTPIHTPPRVLTGEELKKIWGACEDRQNTLPDHSRTIVQLLILTGMKRGEATLRSALLHRSCAPHDMPTTYSSKKLPRAPVSYRCAYCGATFKGRTARARYRLHFSGPGECADKLQRVVEIKNPVGFRIRRKRLDPT